MKHGRKGEYDHINVVAMVPGGERPPAPEGMPDRQIQIWNSIVEAMPAGWFGPETFPVLGLLCLHISISEEIAKVMSAAKRVEDLRKLGIALERETRQISQLSNQLRLTPKSRYENRKGASAADRGASRPWED